ncbi:MAG: hypothetical protein LQ352_005064 [Teloschistes flavicans]|nr:MAG: hypothetical protein LQ352_005064 [Teloschistes flavicans]
MEVLQPRAAHLDAMPQVNKAAFSGTEGVYMLPHHVQEIDRLRRQHWFMKGTTDGALLVSKLPSDQKTLRVLDSGCADGTWLLDLQTQHPEHIWELHGVDIGSSLFPPKRPDLDLRQHDIRQAFPSAWGWSNYFDVIHQRLLVWGLADSAWPMVLRNQLEALKPGGRIELVEVEWIDPDKPHRLPELHKKALMQQWSTKTFGMDIDIAYKLGDILAEVGFVNVQKTQFNHGYGALARQPEQKDGSAELYVECFRNLDEKMPPGKSTIFSGLLESSHHEHAHFYQLDID